VIGISISRVSKKFGEVLALDSVSLEILPGEVFFLLGPSGCGKTTLLLCLAGFYTPDEGEIRFGAEDVTHKPAHNRDAGMVFQNYALWPHKTVAENVAFGLEERRLSGKEVQERVAQALASVRMEDYAGRGIHQLSGGQQQRVALARALVIRPRCLLLDEPLSNLDAKLRLEMRMEIRRICKEFGLTAVYVTHDQKEALSVADRLAVFNEGRICQIGTPAEIYRKPVSRFVADFVGETNFLEGTVSQIKGDKAEVAVGPYRFNAVTHLGVKPGEQVTLSIRPEAWRLVFGDAASAASGINTLKGEVADATYLGEMAQYRMTLSGLPERLKIYQMNPAHVVSSGPCTAFVEPEDVVILQG
jgi:iron(III) transport system ATP-binding protein